MVGKRARRPTGYARRTKKTRMVQKPQFTMSNRTLPDSTKVMLRYCDRFAVAPIAGATMQQVFRGNSLFDPDYTGTGHQPTGFDQLSALYKWYNVLASSIKVELVANMTGTAIASAEVSIIPTVNGGDFGGTEPEVIRENRYGKLKLMSYQSLPQSATHYMTTSKMLGKDVRGTASNTGALYTTNPAEGWFWHVIIQATDEATTLDMVAYVTVTYYADLTQRVALAVS